MRINKMITQEKRFDLLSNSLNTFFKEIYRDQFGEFVCGYWGLNKCVPIVTGGHLGLLLSEGLRSHGLMNNNKELLVRRVVKCKINMCE